VNDPAFILRALHVVSAVALGVFIYFMDGDSGNDLARFVAYPALTLTGVLLWLGRRRAMGRERPPSGG
jgi:hypothetical protein